MLVLEYSILYHGVTQVSLKYSFLKVLVAPYAPTFVKKNALNQPHAVSQRPFFFIRKTKNSKQSLFNSSKYTIILQHNFTYLLETIQLR